MNKLTGHPLIGVITANASLSEQKQLLNGIIEQAQLVGADTAIFSNIYNSSEYFANVEVENKIYDLIVSEKLDGLILTAESFLNQELQNTINRKILSRSNTPIVVTGAEFPEFMSVNNCVEDDFEDITRHLIEVHNFTDIDIITGQNHILTSHERIKGYKKALLEHNIPYDKSKIMYGDFWMTSGEKFAYEYINGNRKLPQAIICANDYMAYGLCDTFLENGISLPDDVTVVGYEYIDERFYHAPILTTYQRNRKAVGVQAVNTLWSMITGKKKDDISLSGRLIYGNTCSCGTDNKQLRDELVQVRREQYYSQLNLVGNFEQQLTLCRSIADYINVLQQFAYLIRDIKGLHLCLYENWCSSDISSSQDGGANSQTFVYYRVITHEPASDEPIYYNKFELFPDVVLQGENGNVLYFCPIFFAGKEFGYFIVQYDKPDCYDIIFRDWLKIAANALEFLRMKNDINTLLEYKNLSAFHDSVTGLYNSNGLRNELTIAKKNADIDNNVLIIFVRSELFSDNSSLDNQDVSVRMDIELAENLKKIAVRKNEFCAKIADKLYAFAAVGEYPDNYEKLLSDKLEALISHAPLYSENCEIDSLIILAHREKIQDFTFNKTIHMLRKRLNERISEISHRRKHTNYSDYLRLRNELYRNPQKSWDAKESCRDFRLSYGHFRATYKELFNISFHQDLIRSRISLAKYLLQTTALSLTAIAYKCGYSDDKYFLRQFRQFTKMTPNLYRSNSSND